MAGFLIPFTLSLLVTISLTFPAAGAFLKSASISPFKLEIEKLSHFQFYVHEIMGGTNPTTITLVKPMVVNCSILTEFGSITVTDGPMTEKPEIGLKTIGRAQGFYGESSQKEIALLMLINFVFTIGRYNGSTLTVLGRNPVNEKVREMPVVGGSGLFRFAKGYVRTSTYSFNNKTEHTIFKYDVYVMHY